MAIESIKLNRRSFTRNSISIEGIKRSVGTLSDGLRKSRAFATKLARDSYEHAKFKSTLISQDRNYFRKRQENFRRKEREDLIEASTVGSSVKKTGSIINNSSRGFLGRMLDALGVIIVGWSVLNFGKIIKHAGIFIRTITRTLVALDSLMDGILDSIEDFSVMLMGVNGTLDPQVSSIENDKRDMQEAVNFVDLQFLEAEKSIVNDVLNYDDPDSMGFGNIKKEFLAPPGSDSGSGSGSSDGSGSGSDSDGGSSDDGPPLGSGDGGKWTIDNYFGNHIDSDDYTLRKDASITASGVSDDAKTLTVKYDDGIIRVYTRLGNGEFKLLAKSSDGREESTNFKVPAFKRGGLVTGFGNEDTIPALLTPGEFVITAETVDKLGSDFFTALNSMSSSNIIPEISKKLAVSETGEVIYNFIEVVDDSTKQMEFDIPKVKQVVSENLISSGSIEQTIMVPIPPRTNNNTGSGIVKNSQIELPKSNQVNIMRALSDLALSYT